MEVNYSRGIKGWLFIGVVMVFVQVLVGGITRLTESGLSITKWEVVKGSLPPMTEEAWLAEFELYKTTPQYKEVNEGMSLSDFKFIYFWEFIHRFWARLMGFVFLIPFLYFLWKKKIDKPLFKNLLVVIGLAMLAATFGWIMVKSGLIERPWVNAYKLSLHLLIAFAVFASLFWTFLSVYNWERRVGLAQNVFRWMWVVLCLYVVQVFFGGILSGMKAAVIFPTWPDMNGAYLPEIIFDKQQWTSYNFNYYDKNSFTPALIHFLHRNTGYLLFFVGSYFAYKLYKIGRFNGEKWLKVAGISVFIVLCMQVTLGIITVLMSIGKIPVLWGVLHQGGALLLLSCIVFSIFICRIKI
jgi:cytochrome c oxidase assembly protein subunit 15